MIEQKNKTKIIILLLSGVFLGALDISVVGPAITSIKESFIIEERLYIWIFSIYVLFNLPSISLFARLSDIYGRKNIYITAIIIFSIGSLIAAFSQNFETLLVGRAIQGFGSGGFLPVATAVVGDIFKPEKRGRILGLIGMIFGLAFVMGPAIAGMILKLFEWKILFLINIPIAILVIAGSLKLLPNTKSDKKIHIDRWGILLFGISLALFVYALNIIDSKNLIQSIVSYNFLPYFIASILIFVLVLFIEKKAKAPIIKVEIFKIRQIKLTSAIAFITGFMQAAFVFLPDFSVNNFKVDSGDAGFMLLPLVISIALGAPLFGRLIDKFGSKIILIIGLILCSLGFYMLHLVESGEMLFYFSTVIIGLGLSIPSGSSLRYIMLNEVGFEDRAVTQGLLTIFIALGQLTGSSVIGAIISSSGGIDGYKEIFLYISMALIIIILMSFWLKNKKTEVATIKHE